MASAFGPMTVTAFVVPSRLLRGRRKVPVALVCDSYARRGQPAQDAPDRVGAELIGTDAGQVRAPRPPEALQGPGGRAALSHSQSRALCVGQDALTLLRPVDCLQARSG